MKFMNMRYLHNYYEEHDDGKGGSSDEPTIKELQAQLAEATKSIDGLKSKNDELLGEKKKEANKRREAEETAKREAQEKAEAAGNYEQLHKSAMDELEKARKENTEIISRQSAKDIKITAMKIAGDLADGKNAELLSEFVTKRLSYSDGNVKVTNKDGDLTISTFDELKTEFKNDDTFASLLKGNQSNGGGATGSDLNGGGAAKLTSTQRIAEGLKSL